jgi:hypothetical protein
MLRLCLAAALLAACAPPLAPTQRPAEPPKERDAPPPAPAHEPAAPPPSEAAQRQRLDAITTACTLERNWDLAPELQVAQCRKRQAACKELMPELRGLAEGGAVTVALAAAALVSGATRHGENLCGRPFDVCKTMVPFEVGSEKVDACEALEWVHPALARAAHGSDVELRLAASRGYRLAQPGDPALVLPALRALLGAARPEPPQPDGSMSPVNQAAANAASALSSFFADGAQALPELLAILRQHADFVAEEQLVVEALFALHFMRQAAAPAMQTLIAVLDDPRPRVRASAANVLGNMGQEARVALGPLQQRLRDGNHEVRDAAQQAIRSITTARDLLMPGF